MSYDVVIVGAGPSGSYLARSLAGRGYRVLVMEKKAAPGTDICCTGIISQQCVGLLELPPSLIITPVSSARVISPSGKSLTLQHSGAIACVVDRPALDRLLAERAQSAGASYAFRTRVSEIAVEDRGISVRAEFGGEPRTCRCRILVIAAGFGSSLPVKLGLGRISDFTVGAQVEVLANADQLEVYLDQEMAPGSFAWLVPTGGGRGLVGLMARRRPGQRLGRLLSRLAAEGKIAPSQCQPKYGPIPLRPLAKTFGSSVLVVGEAAGQVKPLTGGGIYYGALCAGIAAEVVDRAFQRGDFSAGALSSYQRRWREQLGNELRAGYLLHRLLRTLDNGQVDFLHALAARYGIADFVRGAEPGYFDYHASAALAAVKHFARSLLFRPAGTGR